MSREQVARHGTFGKSSTHDTGVHRQTMKEEGTETEASLLFLRTNVKEHARYYAMGSPGLVFGKEG